MKTLAKLLLSIACIALLTNCEKEPQATWNYDPNPAKAFYAEFVVLDFSPVIEYGGLRNQNGCILNWKGLGYSSLFGNFSVNISLTCMIRQGETTGDFCDLAGILILNKDVDELYFSIPQGKITCNTGENCEEFETCFNDLATITGGIGRFTNVSGSFFPNALIHNGGVNGGWYASFRADGSIKNFSYSLNNQHEVTGIDDDFNGI